MSLRCADHRAGLGMETGRWVGVAESLGDKAVPGIGVSEMFDLMLDGVIS